MEEIQQEEKKHNGNDIFHIKEKIYEMILYGNPQLKDFPKTERYVLAGDIRKTMYTMLEMAVRLEKKYHKKTTLQDLDIEVDVLRNLLRLAKDPNLYPNQKPCLNFHTWEVWMRKVDEIGRLFGMGQQQGKAEIKIHREIITKLRWLPFRGSAFNSTSFSGPSALRLNDPRSHSYVFFGFRSALPLCQEALRLRP